MAQMSKGQVPESDSVAEMIAYVSFQESPLRSPIATPARPWTRPGGQRSCQDRRRRGPSTMPLPRSRPRSPRDRPVDDDDGYPKRAPELQDAGTGILASPGTKRHRLAGIFGAQQFLDAVVKPTLSYWRIFDLEDLSAEADQAREKMSRNLAGLTRLAAAQQHVSPPCRLRRPARLAVAQPQYPAKTSSASSTSSGPRTSTLRWPLAKTSRQGRSIVGLSG